VTDDGVITCYPLGAKNIKRITFNDGVVKCDHIGFIPSTHKGEYFHSTLEECEQDGVRLETVPYRPCPYPDHVIQLEAYMNEPNEKKTWAISRCGMYSFISNQNTGFRLVCCALNDSKTIQKRIDEKKANGYQAQTSVSVFDNISRSLK
jgi:hypothetical protein